MAERISNIIREPLQPERRSRFAQLRARSGKLDGACLFGILLLLGVGLIALFTASYADSFYSYGDSVRLIRQQAIFACMGIVAMFVLSYVPYRLILYFHRMIFLVTTVILALTPLIGTDNNTFATRWIRIGPITFQSSEFIKIALIISFAYMAGSEQAKVRRFRDLVHPYGTMVVLIVGLLMMQPHTSASIIVLAIAALMLFVAGMPAWIFPVGGAAGASVFALIWSGKIQIEQIAHVRERLLNWFDPFLNLRDGGWQAANSFIAIGSGGFWGLGLGQGRQKHGLLSEPANDFIFAVWCEEMGFIGAMLVILLFAFLIYRGFYIARNARDKMGCLLATGITAKLAIQTFMNLFVVTGIMPVTGAALPFFSYGGTALLLQLAEMGMLLNVSRSIRAEAKERN